MQNKISWYSLFLGFILTCHSPLLLAADNTAIAAAINDILIEAKQKFDAKEYEKSAATIERAVRIIPNNPVLWHNLSGIRLQQENWKQAVSLAAKSNSLAQKNRQLRIRNWTVISLACEAMQNKICVTESRKRVFSLMQ